MMKMVGTTQKTLNPRLKSLVGYWKLPLAIAFLATGIAVFVVLSSFHRNQVDEAHSAQITLNQIAVLTREINNLTLATLQKQNLTHEADTKMRTARHALPEAVLAAHLHAHHTAAVEKVWPALDTYLSSAGRQWIMMQVRDFDEAKQANFQVSLQFELMQHEVQIATEAEDKWAQAMALRSRNELLASAILAATAILILFLAQETRAPEPVAGDRTQRSSGERRALPRSHGAINRHHSYCRSFRPNQLR